MVDTMGQLTSACTRLATALFFRVGLLAKTHFIGAHLAHPQAGNARGWAVSSGNLSLISLDESFPPEFGEFSISWIGILQKLVQAVELVLRLA
jgi:hypothetical protein